MWLLLIVSVCFKILLQQIPSSLLVDFRWFQDSGGFTHILIYNTI